MKVKYIDGKLTVEMIKDVADFVSLEGDKKIYFACDGGEMGYAGTLIEIINSATDLHFIGTNRLYSAGLYIFSEIKCPKSLSKGVRGMWHQGMLEIIVNTDGTITYTGDKFSHKVLRKSHKRITMALAQKLSLTKKELRKLKKGKDVYFTYKRMKQMFNDV